MSNQEFDYPRVFLFVNFKFDDDSARWLRRTHQAERYEVIKNHLAALVKPLGLKPPPHKYITRHWLVEKRNKVRIRWVPYKGTFHAKTKPFLDGKIAELQASDDDDNDDDDIDDYHYDREDGEDEWDYECADDWSGPQENQFTPEHDLFLESLTYRIEAAPARPRKTQGARSPTSPSYDPPPNATHTSDFHRGQPPHLPSATPAPPASALGIALPAPVPSGRNRAEGATQLRPIPERTPPPEEVILRCGERRQVERAGQEALSSSAIPLGKAVAKKRPRPVTVQTTPGAQAIGPAASTTETHSPSPSSSSDQPSKQPFSFFTDRKRPRTGIAATSRTVPVTASSAAGPLGRVAGDIIVTKTKAKAPRSSKPVATSAAPPAEEPALSSPALSSAVRPTLSTERSAPAVLEAEMFRLSVAPSQVSPTPEPMQGLPESSRQSLSPVEADELSRDDRAVLDVQRTREVFTGPDPSNSANALAEPRPILGPAHLAIGGSAPPVPAVSSFADSDRAPRSALQEFLGFSDDEDLMAPTPSRSPSPLVAVDDLVDDRPADNKPALRDNIVEQERGSASPQEDIRMTEIFSNDEDAPASTAPTSSSSQPSVTDHRNQRSSRRVQQQVLEPETSSSDAERQSRQRKRQRSESPPIVRPAQRMRATEPTTRKRAPRRDRPRQVSRRVPPPPDSEASDPEDILPVAEQKRKRAVSPARSPARAKRRRSSLVHPASDADEHSDAARADGPRLGSTTSASVGSAQHGERGRLVADARPAAAATPARTRLLRAFVELPRFFKAESPAPIAWAAVPRSRSTSPGSRSDGKEEDELDSSSSSAESSHEDSASTHGKSNDTTLEASARRPTGVHRATNQFEQVALARSQRQEDLDLATWVPSTSVRVDPKAKEERLKTLRPRDSLNIRKPQALPAFLDDPEPPVADASPRRVRRARVQRRGGTEATPSLSSAASIAESVAAESSRSTTPEVDSRGSPASCARDADDDPMEDEDHVPPPSPGPAEASNALLTDDEIEMPALSEDLVDDAASLEPNVASPEPETGGDTALVEPDVEPDHFTHLADEEKKAPLRSETPHIDLRLKTRPVVTTPALRVHRDVERSAMTSESPTSRGGDIFAPPSSSPIHARASAGSAIRMPVNASVKPGPEDAKLPALLARDDASVAPAVTGLRHGMDRNVNLASVVQLPSSEPAAIPTRGSSHNDGAFKHPSARQVTLAPSPTESHRIVNLQASLEEERRVAEEQRRQIVADQATLQAERRRAAAAEDALNKMRAQFEAQLQRADAAEAAKAELERDHAALVIQHHRMKDRLLQIVG